METLVTTSICGMEISHYSHDTTASRVGKELSYYVMPDVEVLPGDVILDIGANLGLVSILFSRIYPKSKIYAYEPVKKTYDLLVKNVADNGADNVCPVNAAVTFDGRLLPMRMYSSSSGGATGFGVVDRPYFEHFTVPSVAFDALLSYIGEVKLLKIDCEGGEHEILLESKKLHMVKNLVGEIHENDFLKSKGFSNLRLDCHLRTHIKGVIKTSGIRMSE